MINVGRMARIVYGSREACGEANLATDAAEQDAAKNGGQGSSLETGTDGMASKGMNRQLFWSSIGHGQTVSNLYGIERSHVLFYQRLGESLPFFMKNSG